MAGPGGSSLNLNASGFVSGMTAAARATEQLKTALASLANGVNAANAAAQQTAAAAQKMGSAARDASSKMKDLKDAVEATNQTLLGLAAIQFGQRLAHQFQQATQEAAEFQRSIALIRTITQDANLSQQQWASGISKVSSELGKPLGEVAAASYDLLSNQVAKAGDAFDLTRTAGELAKASNGSTVDSVNALSSAYNTFRLKTYEVKGVSQEFFSTIDLGRISLSEFANSSGRPFLFGQSIGASFREVNASVAALTQSGIRADTAYTLINNVFQQLLNPSKEMEEAFKKLNVSSGEGLVKTYGWTGALEKLYALTRGSASEIAKLFPNVRGEQGFSALATKIDVVKNAMNDAATSSERYGNALEEVGGTSGNQLAIQTQEALNDLTLGLKTNLLEAVTSASGAMGGLTAAMHTAIQTATELGAAWVAMRAGTWALTLTPAGAALTAVGVAALALSNIYSRLKEKADGAYEAIGKEISARNLTKEESVDAGLRKGTEEFAKRIQDVTRAKLEELTQLRKGLNKIGEAAEEAGSNFREGFKNSVELAMSAVRDQLQTTTAQLNKTLEALKNFDKDKAAIRTFGQDTLYSAKKTAIDAAHPGNDPESIQSKISAEARLAEQRLGQFAQQMKQAVRTGNSELFHEALTGRQQLIGQLASETFTDADGVTRQKYLNIEERVNEELKYQLSLRGQLQESMKKQARELEAQRVLEQDTLKELEDAAAKLNKDLKPVDAKGKPKGETAAEYASKLDQDKKQVDDLFRKLQEGRGEKVIGIPEVQKDLMAHRIREANAQFGRVRAQALTERNVAEDQEATNKTEEAITKGGAAGLAKYKEAAEAVSKLTKETDAYNKVVEQNIELLRKGSGSALLGEAKKDLGAGKYDEAVAKLKRYKEAVEDAASSAIANENRPETTINKGGKNVEISGVVDETISQARVAQSSVSELKAAQVALSQAAAADIAQQSSPAIASMQALISGSQDLQKASQGSAEAISNVFNSTHDALEQAKASADELIAKLQQVGQYQTIPTAGGDWSGGEDSSGAYATGGFVKYLARGGFSSPYARGTDTIPAMLSPGEFVVRANQARRFGPMLDRLNNGYYADGGGVGEFPGSLSLMNPSGGSSPSITNTTNVGDIHVGVTGGSTSGQTINQIASGIQRGIRRGIIKGR